MDTCAAVLSIDNGTLALVSNSRYNLRGYDVPLELHGSRESVAVGLEDKLPLRSVQPGGALPPGEPHPAFTERFRPAYQVELAAFTDVVPAPRPSPCTLEGEWVAEAWTLSCREHGTVQVAEARALGEPA